MRRLAVLFLSLVTTVANAQSASELPDIGNPAGAIITESDEYRIGRMIVNQLRDEGVVVDDPEINEYLQAIGSRIAAQTPDGGRPFQFFAVRDNTINAFALPGGFIGVNAGLVLATRNESELASVLAHEIAHVTQRHIARTVRAQGKQSIAATAAILAAVLIGAMAGGSGDAMQGAIAIAQGAAAQQQVNFTRANEYEADRVGISFLASAGFNPQAMPSFFETMGRRTGLAGSYVPEMIQSHPVSSNRIAESRNRALQYGHVKVSESPSYPLIRERLRVITAPRETDLSAQYRKERAETAPELGSSYGEALALMAANKPQDATKILYPLAEQNQSMILLQIALAQSELAAGLTNDGTGHLRQGHASFSAQRPCCRALLPKH